MLTATVNIFSSQNALNGNWQDINNCAAFSIYFTGMEAKTWIEVSNDPNVLTSGAGIAAPAAPVLGQYAPTYGELAGIAAPTTYYVKNTYVTQSGETVASTESSLLVTAGNLLTVASPVKDSGGYANGWNTYIGTTSGGESLQNIGGRIIQPLELGQTFVLSAFNMSSQTLPPTVNTSGTPTSGINVTPPDVTTAGAQNIDMTELIYDSVGHKAIWTPSCLVFRSIRVCKDATSQTMTTNAFLFSQHS